jgi:N-sulfoglucosamine sulfohydrolase
MGKTGAAAGMAALATALPGNSSEAPPNILLITADDLNYDSTGVYGCDIDGITPNIDRLASEGMRFNNAHITIAVCQPSRSVLMTGRYPHRNGAKGFGPIDSKVMTLQERLNEAGYMNGILGKNTHLEPAEKFRWDYYITSADLGRGRTPKLYYDHAKRFFEDAKEAKQPFFLMANSDDPHRPFAGSDRELRNWGKHSLFNREFALEEVDVPEFLPDLPEVRREIAEYFTSVHRCDETVGEVLRALEDAGLQENTLVIFLSDNGMAFPFAKTNCYLNSTKTPWIVRWPEAISPGLVDQEHFVSGIDFMPTILDATGLVPEQGMDGTSFLPLILGQKQSGRDFVYTVFHETAAKRRYEMRSVQNSKFGYIYNGWSDGSNEFQNALQQRGPTMPAMKAAAEIDPEIAARVELFLYRAPEELYDFESDPHALVNLIDSPAHQSDVRAMRGKLAEWMNNTGDPIRAEYRAFVDAANLPIQTH